MAQADLQTAGKAALIVVGGAEGAGKAQLVDLMLEWFDPRGVRVHSFGAPTQEERQRPRLWRYWQSLPPKGKSVVLLGSWHTDPIVQKVFKRITKKEFARELEGNKDFEAMLAREGVILIKLWLCVTKAQQYERLSRLQKDPLNRWRVSEKDWAFHRKYDRFFKVSAKAIKRTDSPAAPWLMIDASDNHSRDLAAAKAILARLKEGVAQPKPQHGPADRPKPVKGNALQKLDLTLKLEEGEYEKKLERLQARLNLLTRRMRQEGRSLVLVFEGTDAAGKGGAIKRLTRAMDARNYQVVSVAAPNEEERSHPYLWRFWRHLPGDGRVTIFDRSWYGRVLVERVEGFCATEDWKRAFAEINDFEAQAAASGCIVLKFWLSTSQEEQLKRFKEREKVAYKRFKVTQEDWRNRDKWDAYEASACEAFEKTDTKHAPWLLVEAEDKHWARIKVLKSICRALEESL